MREQRELEACGAGGKAFFETLVPVGRDDVRSERGEAVVAEFAFEIGAGVLFRAPCPLRRERGDQPNRSKTVDSEAEGRSRKRLFRLVARGGIEPPTRGFSIGTDQEGDMFFTVGRTLPA